MSNKEVGTLESVLVKSDLSIKQKVYFVPNKRRDCSRAP